MKDRSILITNFQDYANSLQSGYLKIGKASNMIMFLTDHRLSITHDEVRFLSYLKNSLEMEGFNSTGIELIMGWLYGNIA